MKYFSYVKHKQFTHALAALSPRSRYATAKLRWYAARLGLYHTVLQYTPWTPVKTRRHQVVTAIASIKRQTLTDESAKSCIRPILYNKKYRQFHNEFIKDIISYYPQEVLKFLEVNSEYLANSYYQGLYFALLHEYCHSSFDLDSRLDNFLVDRSESDYADKKCLYNNITLNHTLSKLTNLNQIFSHHQLANIDLINDQYSFTVTNLKAAATLIQQQKNKQKYESVAQQQKVTVVVTAYNANATIDSCINSLLQQTWSNLEVIVIDDASTDDTLTHLQHLSKRHAALKIIALPQNVGTFAAKSIGAQYATGEFLTCQDSDDWAHPQKIAEQVQPLIDNPNLIATTSYWLRLDHKGQYYVRQIYPFMRQNPASPMFRLQAVNQRMGLWHIVRTGADSEFYERLKLIYGNERIGVIKKPLTIASHRPNSLMTSEEFGIYNHTAALARLDYWEAWRLWHIDMLYKKNCPFMPTVQQQADATQAVFIGIPDSIKVNKLNLQQSVVTPKVLNI
ncbi:glycosyltransferase family 2 protein [Psychrobacter sp. CAL346-MNA-CIBAN-0220]|uniref:glycosyltransferase family 2 protein n=1 Tax=Psychrobacter sp. CAL346-MNA-CIBAN-0220 TaxID=3140457 RepID=UPI00332EBDBB